MNNKPKPTQRELIREARLEIKLLRAHLRSLKAQKAQKTASPPFVTQIFAVQYEDRKLILFKLFSDGNVLHKEISGSYIPYHWSPV